MLEGMAFLFMLWGITLAWVTSFMILLWLVSLITQRLSVLDIGWGVGFIFCALVYFIAGEGYVWRRILILTLVALWALRLTSYLLERFKRKEDPRYQALIPPGGKHPRLRGLAFALLQGLLVSVLSLPFGVMSQNSAPFFSAAEVFGLLIWGVGLVGEATADYQLARFKQEAGHHDQVLQSGLWRYSRHPNYFFELIIWIGYAWMAASSPGGWIAIAAPLLMFYLLLYVSGVPLAEAQALQTKGEAYRDYQKKTSLLVPWFRKR